MNAPKQNNKFTPGMELNARSICNYDCIFRGTVIKRTAKQVTIDCGGRDVVTVKIFVDDEGGEYCYPAGRYSMAHSFHAGKPEAPLKEAATPEAPKPTATPSQLAQASAICGEEVGEILSGAETLTGEGFETVEVSPAIPQRAGEPIPTPSNVVAFPSPVKLSQPHGAGFEKAVRNALDLYCDLLGISLTEGVERFKSTPSAREIVELLVLAQADPVKLRAFASKI